MNAETDNNSDHEQDHSLSPWKAENSLWTDGPFLAGLVILSSFYILLIGAMLSADILFASSRPHAVIDTLKTPEIRYAVWLSLLSCSITAILSLWVAIPIGYLMSRFQFPGKSLLDSILDIPIFLPPLVIGLSLLILFRQTPLRILDDYFGIAFHVPAVILAQFSVASAFAVRTLRSTFDTVSPRVEQVALTLGCSRSQAFFAVVIPQCWRGIMTAGILAWARALGEFGPILVFAGSTRRRTEVLPVSVHMELSIGNIEGAVGVSLLMVVIALSVLIVVRLLSGQEKIW
ncbi:MAG: ABC transporter permease [Pirellulaceae bacterium]|nr:ABC transporter permease [Pirellulaceae bacterium]